MTCLNLNETTFEKFIEEDSNNPKVKVELFELLRAPG
jgi:hypothetical protein